MDALEKRLDREFVNEAGLLTALEPIKLTLSEIKGGLSVGRYILAVIIPLVAAAVTAAAIFGSAAAFSP